jgi:ribosomal protein S18 acetylase RimI-like enzyme
MSTNYQLSTIICPLYLCGAMKKSFISFATVDDAIPILQLVNNAYRGEEAKKGWTHEADLIDGTLRIDEKSLKELLRNPNAVVLKCTDEKDQIIGCVYLEKSGKKLYLGMLSVSPDVQAQGIGKKLLSASEDYALQNNCTAIDMTVISIRHELIAWYERNGYSQTGETKPFPDDNRFGTPRMPIEFVVMEKCLNRAN